MTTNRHPGGVAGRVLEQVELRAKGGLPDMAERFAGQHQGATMLHVARRTEPRGTGDYGRISTIG